MTFMYGPIFGRPWHWKGYVIGPIFRPCGTKEVKFLVRNGYVNCQKIEGLDACDKVVGESTEAPNLQNVCTKYL